MTESTVVQQKLPCPDTSECGSSDAYVLYDDGHGHCYSCGKTWQNPDMTTQQPRKAKAKGLVQGEITGLDARGIFEETCRKFGYKTGTDPVTGEFCHIADFKGKDGRVCGQKLRFQNKDFRITGDLKPAGLYGQWLWPAKGKRIVITEGEIDALTVSQIQDNKWPTVSLPSGASSAKKSIEQSLEFLLGYDEIILFFDNDEPGQEAVLAAANVLPPGSCKVAKLDGFKDPNEALQQGNGRMIMQAIYDAKEYRPDGIVAMADIRDKILQAPEVGRAWPWDSLTTWTYGRRRREIYTFGAGTGIGKTDVLTQIVAHITEVDRDPVAMFYLEQPTGETGKRVAGKICGRRFWIPDDSWTQEELEATVDKMEEDNLLYLYDHFGSTDWDVIKGHIRFLAHAEGVHDFVIDHLTALADPDRERESLETLMKDVATLAQELDITIYLISHLSTPKGTSHEEGGRVTSAQFKGSRSIGFWSHFMFGLERNTQADDPLIRSTTTFRVLKDRYTGQATGKLMYLGYDADSGMLNETQKPTEGASMFPATIPTDEEPF